MKPHARLMALSVILAVFCLAPSIAMARNYGIYQSDINGLTQLLNKSEAEAANNPDDVEALRAAGIAAHQLALFHGKGYAEKSVSYLQKIVDKDRNDALALAYLGSAHALVARDASVIMTKISNVNKGLSLLNRAVRLAPEDFVVRMVRGSVIFELPSMFKKPENAIEDFSYAESRFDSLPDIIGIQVDALKAEVYYKLGSLKKEMGDKKAAEEYFAKAISAGPDTNWAQLAKKE